MRLAHQVREAFEAVDESSIAMEIVPVSPESSVELGQGCFVRPFLVQHRWGTVVMGACELSPGGRVAEEDGKCVLHFLCIRALNIPT